MQEYYYTKTLYFAVCFFICEIKPDFSRFIQNYDTNFDPDLKIVQIKADPQNEYRYQDIMTGEKFKDNTIYGYEEGESIVTKLIPLSKFSSHKIISFKTLAKIHAKVNNEWLDFIEICDEDIEKYNNPDKDKENINKKNSPSEKGKLNKVLIFPENKIKK